MSIFCRRMFSFVLALLCFCDVAAAEGDQPIQLFDGKTLAGWTAMGGKPVTKNWSVEDGTLALNGVGGSIFTADEYADFDLSFQWKIAPRGNSGVKYRVVYYEKGVYGRPSWLGCEYQIYDNANDKATTRNSSGALYDLYPPEPKGMLRPAGEFNDSRIVVQGPKIEHWLNGVKIVSADMSSDDWKEKDQRQQIQERQRLHEEAEGTHRAAGSSQPCVVPQHRADAAGFEGVETGKWWAAVTSTKLAKAAPALLAWAFVGALATARAEETNPRADALSPDVWRREHRLIDLHMHVEGLPERYERAARIMDAVGIGAGG